MGSCGNICDNNFYFFSPSVVYVRSMTAPTSSSDSIFWPQGNSMLSFKSCSIQLCMTFSTLHSSYWPEVYMNIA